MCVCFVAFLSVVCSLREFIFLLCLLSVSVLFRLFLCFLVFGFFFSHEFGSSVICRLFVPCFFLVCISCFIFSFGFDCAVFGLLFFSCV